MLTGSEIRRKFLDFFVQAGHREVHSSSLVPQNDPTLLFTNAGMNQFKDVFLGLEKRDYTRATTSQKCVRAGGKHNDLENVGFTNRPHTFFEMLGNLTFGDYFKKDAIAYAWELSTAPEWLGIPEDKLFVTIFNVEGAVRRDAEAYVLWLAQGVAKDRVYEFGLKDNFWQMGDTGPCGPCSEIHYDMGPTASDQGHTDCAFGCDCGRYVEIWNLVFMQFDRDASGKLNPLPKPSIDTGMGLERVTAVLQGVISNYETDLFVPLIKGAAELTGHVGPGLRPGQAGQSPASTQTEAGSSVGTSTTRVGTGVPPVQAERSSAAISKTSSGASLRRAGEGTRPYASSGTNHVGADALVRPSEQKSAASLRVIADHSRAATFLISDGVLPSNEGRGYVLRKIIRRAITHGRLLGQTKPFLHEMVFAVRDLMQDAYPELKETGGRVSRAVLAEETRFARTVDLGLKKLEEDILEIAADKESAQIDIGKQVVFPGERAFKLYDTFGLPLDFIEDVLGDQGIPLIKEGFDRAMAEQRERARASWKGAARQTANPAYQQLPKSEFEGYLQTRSENCEVLAIIKNGQGAQELKPGEEGEIILDHTPFYAESGGQVGDRGVLTISGHHLASGGSQEVRVPYAGFMDQAYVIADAKGCYYPVQGVRAHQVFARQPIRVGDRVDA